MAQLFVGQLPFNKFYPEDLERIFSPYGVVIGRELYIRKGNGFVLFRTTEEADAAIMGLHGRYVVECGRHQPLQVMYSKGTKLISPFGIHHRAECMSLRESRDAGDKEGPSKGTETVTAHDGVQESTTKTTSAEAKQQQQQQQQKQKWTSYPERAMHAPYTSSLGVTDGVVNRASEPITSFTIPVGQGFSPASHPNIQTGFASNFIQQTHFMPAAAPAHGGGAFQPSSQTQPHIHPSGARVVNGGIAMESMSDGYYPANTGGTLFVWPTSSVTTQMKSSMDTPDHSFVGVSPSQSGLFQSPQAHTSLIPVHPSLISGGMVGHVGSVGSAGGDVFAPIMMSTPYGQSQQQQQQQPCLVQYVMYPSGSAPMGTAAAPAGMWLMPSASQPAVMSNSNSNNSNNNSSVNGGTYSLNQNPQLGSLSWGTAPPTSQGMNAGCENAYASGRAEPRELGAATPVIASHGFWHSPDQPPSQFSTNNYRFQ